MEVGAHGFADPVGPFLVGVRGQAWFCFGREGVLEWVCFGEVADHF